MYTWFYVYVYLYICVYKYVCDISANLIPTYLTNSPILYFKHSVHMYHHPHHLSSSSEPFNYCLSVGYLMFLVIAHYL